MGQKVTNMPIGAEASDLGRNYIVNISGAAVTGTGGRGGAGTSVSGGGAGAGGSGAGSGGAGATGSGFNDFSNMISGIDPTEADLFKIILGQNYTLATTMAGVKPTDGAARAETVVDLQTQYVPTNKQGESIAGLTDSLSANMKLVLIGGGLLLALVIFKRKK